MLQREKEKPELEYMEETSFSSGNAYFKFFVYTLCTAGVAFGIYKGLKYLDGL